MQEACRKSLRGVLADGASTPLMAHPGVILDRYLESHDGKQESKKQLFKAAIRSCAGAEELYRAAFARYQITRGSELMVKAEGRLIVGLGEASVLETGITLHHTYGTPYIPSTGLKGLAAHYCHDIWGEDNADFKEGGKLYEVLFGSVESGGRIAFHDGWLTPDSLAACLKPDVMTVHHNAYYAGEQPPTDFDDPNPIHFLSVSGSFLIKVTCDVDTADGKKWEGLALELLLQAFADRGVGAKTNSGYGRLVSATIERNTAENVKPQVVPKSGDKIHVRRVEDPKHLGRVWFEALDGSGSGTILGGVSPDVAMAEETTLAVHSYSKGSYNFRLPDLDSERKKDKKIDHKKGFQSGARRR